jgi:hypothetical protein
VVVVVVVVVIEELINLVFSFDEEGFSIASFCCSFCRAASSSF